MTEILKITEFHVLFSGVYTNTICFDRAEFIRKFDNDHRKLFVLNGDKEKWSIKKKDIIIIIFFLYMRLNK